MKSGSGQIPEAPGSFGECFSFDESQYNPCPKSSLRKLSRLYFNQRYSMTTLMRLAQFFCEKSKRSKGRLLPKLYYAVSSYLVRKNQVLNRLECAHSPLIGRRVVFHHANVVITHNTVIESDVHIYGNVIFGEKNGLTPYVKKFAKIGANTVIIGGVTIGERAIVAPGAVVIHDVPDNSIVGGIPAKVLGMVNDDNYRF